MDVGIAENTKHLGKIRRQEGYRHTHIKENIYYNRKNFSFITICNKYNLLISIDYYTMEINWYKERDEWKMINIISLFLKMINRKF